MTVRTTPRQRATTVLAIALCGALGLSGCAAGQDAATANSKSVVDGASADVGAIALRNAGIASPSTVEGYRAGQQAELVVSIVNNSITSDELISVSSSASARVQIVATGSADSSSSASSSASSASTSSGPSASTSSGASASTSSAASSPIAIPANTLVRVGADAGPTVTLTDLKANLIPGQTVAVTFTFQSAGSVTFQLPVKLILDSTGGQTEDIEPTGGG